MQHAQAGLPARVADARFPTHAGLHAPGQQRGPGGSNTGDLWGVGTPPARTGNRQQQASLES